MSKHTEPREVRAGTQRQQAQSQRVHLTLHSARDLASLPKERQHHSLGLLPWDTREDCIVPTGSLPALLTLPAPSTTCSNWDDLAKGQHPPWTQCWSILTELLLTVWCTSQRASQQILHWRMVLGCFLWFFSVDFFPWPMHACMHPPSVSSVAAACLNIPLQNTRQRQLTAEFYLRHRSLHLNMCSILNVVNIMSNKSPPDYIGKKREKKSKTPSFWIDHSENNEINSSLTFWVQKGPVCGSWVLNCKMIPGKCHKGMGRADTGNARTGQRSKAGTESSAFISLCWWKNSSFMVGRSHSTLLRPSQKKM